MFKLGLKITLFKEKVFGYYFILINFGIDKLVPNNCFFKNWELNFPNEEKVLNSLFPNMFESFYLVAGELFLAFVIMCYLIGFTKFNFLK